MSITTVLDIDQWLNNLEIGIQQGDFRGPSFIKPYLFVTLVTELKRAAVKNLELNDEFQSYMTRMGLWEALDKKPPRAVIKKNEEGRFLPIHAIRSEDDVNLITKKLMKILQPICIDHATYISIDSLLIELLGNCFYHAKSPIGTHGFVCCQPWKKNNLLQIAIADGGIGIKESLSGNPKLRSRLLQENSCELATEYQVTGKPGSHHSGYGLTLTRALVEQNFGNLIIVSRNEFFRSYEQNVSKGKMHTNWEGTLLIIELNLTQPMDSKKIYDSWPLPEGFTDEDFTSF